MLHCDASDVALGAELSQGGKSVAFFSKKLTPTEARYHMTDRELMAIYAACMKWRQYLHGNRCIVYTDHKALTYIYNQPHLNSRQARWLERLAELDVHIVYKPGVTNVSTDVLPRFV